MCSPQSVCRFGIGKWKNSINGQTTGCFMFQHVLGRKTAFFRVFSILVVYLVKIAIYSKGIWMRGGSVIELLKSFVCGSNYE